MRTTVDIDDDVLHAVREISRAQRQSVGKVVSQLLRVALAGRHGAAEEPAGQRVIAGGFRPFAPRSGKLVTHDDIDRLRDIEGV